MKACFLLQRNFAYLGHILAIILKNKYRVEQFCGFVNLRSSHDFLKNQKDIDYSSLLLDEDIHEEFKNTKLDLDFLKKMEKDYGIPNLWPYIAIDRVIMSNQLVREYPYDKSPYNYEEILRILQIKAKTILNFLKTEKPDFIVFSAVAAMGSMLLFHMAKKMGIKTFVIHPSYIKNSYLLSEKYDDFSYVKETANSYLEKNIIPETVLEKAKLFLENFRSAPHPHYEPAHPSKQPLQRAKQFQFLLPKNLKNNIFSLAKNFYEHYSKKDRHDYDYIGPWNYLKDSFKRKVRNLIGINDLYDQSIPNEDFAFYPLHVEPEIATLLYAPFFTDQIHLIKLIARSLPVGYKLYVKEHPMMVVYRPRSFYKEIKKTPNVRLINPAVTSFELILNAKLITTISGSVGWEGTLLKKPVITFGNIFYNQLSFVKHCKTPEEMPYLVKEQLENFKFDENELSRLIAAIFEESVDVPLSYLWEKETDSEKRKAGLEPLAELIMKKFTFKNVYA